MEEFMKLITTPTGVFLLTACVVLFVFVLLFGLLLRRLQTRDAEMRGDVGEIQERLDSLLIDVTAKNTQEREEMTQNLRGFNDSIVTVMGEMSRTQQGQLDSFGGQIRAMSRTDEERLERMRRNIEEKLGQYDQVMVRVNTMLDAKLNSNERRLEQMRTTLAESLQALQVQNEQKLEQIRVTVGDKLDSTLDKRLGDSFRIVSERLEQVYRGLGEMQSLAEGVGDLKKVLTNVKTRGIWGEVQLGALLEQILAKNQYDVNVAVKPGSSETVEFAVRLPGKDEGDGQVVYLPIDAKFPLEDYQRLLEASEAGDVQRVQEATRALELTIRAQARRIRNKYVDPPHTTDFAILFLPVEGLYAEVLRHGDIVEKLQSEFRVVITGPTTLLALLNSLQMGFRTVAIERRSSEVWALLGAVKTEFGRFAELLTRTQKRLRLASDSIEDAARKTRTIQRKLQRVEALSEDETKLWIGEEGAMPMNPEGEETDGLDMLLGADQGDADMEDPDASGSDMPPAM